MPKFGDFNVEFGQKFRIWKTDAGLPTAITEGLSRVSTKLSQEAKRLVPVRTGELKKSIRGVRAKHVSPQIWTYGFEAQSDYAKFVEKGTGLYGPKKHLIEADPGALFRFVGDNNSWVRAKALKGQHAQPFMQPAVDFVNANVDIGDIIGKYYEKGLGGDVI